jgi:hypothetical protein
LEALFPEGPAAQSPGELYMAFGPEHRVVKAKRVSDGALVLAHVARGEGRLWSQHCEAQPYVEDAEGTSLYEALRRVVDGCADLVELEP